MPDWFLENVEITAKENPQSFFIPSKKERENLQDGDPVRLHFVLTNPAKNEPRAERMWLDIKERTPDGNYVGILTNQPLYIKNLVLGQEIEFEPCHIARTLIRKNDPRWVDCAEKKAFVSKMAFDKNEILRFAYREEADRDEDSGWRFFTGHEDDDYINDSNNIRICIVGWLLDFDPSIDAFIREPIGAVYERKNRKEGWYKVTDWESPKD